MNVSEQQEQILSVAITLPGPFKPKDRAHKMLLSYAVYESYSPL